MTTARLPLVQPRPVAKPLLARREAREVAFMLAHVPLALIIRNVQTLSLLHAISLLGLGLMWSQSRKTVHRTLFCAAYVAGAEVLWRMTGGTIIYEYGKYACALLLLAAYPRRPGARKSSALPVLFFLLLIPSILLSLNYFGFGFEARRQISFNLSGPFCLAVAAFVFSGCRSAYLDLRALMLAVTAPIIGISTTVATTVLTAEVLRFGDESNFVTSGGFGPNQVSALLGLGAVFCLFFALSTQALSWRMVFVGMSMVMTVQAVLTFSRGGVVNAVICVAILAVHFLQQPRTRIVLLVVLVLFGIFGTQVVVPRLNEFTGGMISERFGEIDPSLRREIAQHEIRIFLDHPTLGVGPGVAKEHRRSALHTPIAAHTEYTRLLAEHGALGAGALCILFLLVGRAYVQAPTALTKAWVATLAAWPMLEMLHAAMRVSSISLLFGLALIHWYQPPQDRRTQRPPGQRPPGRSPHVGPQHGHARRTLRPAQLRPGQLPGPTASPTTGPARR